MALRVVDDNGAGHINKVKLRRARLVLGLVITLAIPLWVSAVSTGDGFGHRWGRNGEFCVSLGPVICTGLL